MLSLFKHLYQYITIIFFLIIAAGRARAQQVVPIPFPLEKENFSIAGFAAYTLAQKALMIIIRLLLILLKPYKI